MPLPCFRPALGLLALTLGSVSLSFAQDDAVDKKDDTSDMGKFAGVGVVPKLTISRKDIPNFLADEDLIAKHFPKATEDDSIKADLQGLFTVGADSSRYAFFWDPLTCRLLGVLDLDPSPAAQSDSEDESARPTNGDENDSGGDGDEESAPDASPPDPPSPFFLLAGSPHPLSSTAGGSDESVFFGVRLIDGKPEFLYEQGSLLVEERLWLENGGETLQQLFTFRDMDSPLVINVPESWRERVTADRGEWKENTLTVPKDEAGELRLTYRLANKATGPEAEKEDVE